jgi:hypothetical protein
MGFETTDQHGWMQMILLWQAGLRAAGFTKSPLPDLCKDKKNTRAACWDGS